VSRRLGWGWRHRLAGIRAPRVLLGPATALAALELVGLAGPGAPAQISIVTALSIGFPLLAWAGRQVLDAAPDDQQRLDALALGGDGRARTAGLLAAGSVVRPLAVLCLICGAAHVDHDGTRSDVLVAGAGLAIGTAAAATAVASLASRRVVGPGAASLVVLVAAPVLTAVLSAARGPVVLLVPALGPALRTAYGSRLPAALPELLLQLVIWSALLIAVTQSRLVRRW